MEKIGQSPGAYAAIGRLKKYRDKLANHTLTRLTVCDMLNACADVKTRELNTKRPVPKSIFFSAYLRRIFS